MVMNKILLFFIILFLLIIFVLAKLFNGWYDEMVNDSDYLENEYRNASRRSEVNEERY